MCPACGKALTLVSQAPAILAHFIVDLGNGKSSHTASRNKLLIVVAVAAGLSWAPTC